MTDENNDHIHPTVKKIFVGHSLEIKCDITPGMRWYYEKTRYLPKSEPIAHKKSKIVIESMQLSDAGSYFCYGTEDDGKKFIARSKVIVYGNLLF